MALYQIHAISEGGDKLVYEEMTRKEVMAYIAERVGVLMLERDTALRCKAVRLEVFVFTNGYRRIVPFFAVDIKDLRPLKGWP